MSSAEKTVMFALPNVVTGQIACVAGTAAGRSWELSAGTFVIGRLEENDLALPQEPGVSKVHAKIIGQSDRYLITDCESRNGTLLNGELIQRADLYDGDEIRICGCTLRFTQKGGAKRPRRDAPPAAPVAPASAAEFGPPTALLAQPQQPPPQMSLPPQALPPPSGGGKILAAWYAGGLLTTLLLGGAASAALVVTSPEITPTPPSTTTTTVTTTTTTTPAATTTAQPTTARIPELGLPAVPPPPTADMGDAGVAAVDVAAPTTPPPATATPPVTPPPTVPEPAVAEPEVPDPEEDAAPSSSTKPRRKRTPRVDRAEPAAVVEAAPAAAATAPAEGGTLYAAVVDGGKSETLKTRTGGRVKTVDAKDGDVVTKGQQLVTFESGADPAEIATLQDRIASLENAEDDEAKRELKAAKQKLAALEGGQKAQPITAGLDGKLSGFSVTVGAILKAGDVVGKVADGDVPSRVRITVAKGAKVSKGMTVTLILRAGGTGEGTVVALSGKNVIVDTGSEAGDAVEAVKF